MLPSRRCLALALAFALGGALQPLDASAAESRTSIINIDTCTATPRSGETGESWMCKGIDGYPVYLAEGDVRQFVSAGPDPDKRKAAQQTLGAFNSIFGEDSNKAEIEWRLDTVDGKLAPHALIIRYYTTTDDPGIPEGQVLAVIKISPSESCHIAYIDALATPGAEVLARRIADTAAKSFDCSGDPQIVGETGKSPM